MTIDQFPRESNVYARDVTDIYDVIYVGRGKDYRKEAQDLADLIRGHLPAAASLVDLACGTGEHLVYLRDMFDHVEGVDLSERMVEVARAKLPDVPISLGDIRDFDLGRTFDAVCCLYSTVGYLATTAELDTAIANMARHVAPGGLLVIEQWWTPDRFIEGYISDDLVRTVDGRVIARVAHSTRVGDVCRQESHYVLADVKGIEHFSHLQHLTLFKATDYESALERAGCTIVEHIDRHDVLTGRGIYVGTVR